MDDAEDQPVFADPLDGMKQNENGAALTLPSSLSVVTQAIGRGVTIPARIG